MFFSIVFVSSLSASPAWVVRFFTCIIKVRAVLENIQAVLFTFLLIYGIIKLIDKLEFDIEKFLYGFDNGEVG